MIAAENPELTFREVDQLGERGELTSIDMESAQALYLSAAQRLGALRAIAGAD